MNRTGDARLDALIDAATLVAKAPIATSDAYEAARAVWRQYWKERDARRDRLENAIDYVVIAHAASLRRLGGL